jgi:hypothetical protein
MFPLEPRHALDVLPQAMAHGGTIIRPGAVAWGGIRDPADAGHSSCEGVERALTTVARSPGELPGLLAELAASRLWVPLPDVRPFTDGSVVRLPLISYQGGDFVPCFTSAQRLTSWAGHDHQAPHHPQQRAGDPRLVPHIVLPAVGLARRLPAGLGLALNPDGAPGLPLYPDCVPYLARLSVPAILAAASGLPHRGLGMAHLVAHNGVRFLIGHPPAEPFALLAQLRTLLHVLLAVRQASRAWLSVRGQGEGLLISVTLDDPASEPAHAAVVEVIERAAAAVPLRVPFLLDVKFPGEPQGLARPSPANDLPVPRGPSLAGEPGLTLVPQARPANPPISAAPPISADAIDSWIAANTRPFYVRDHADLPVR